MLILLSQFFAFNVAAQNKSTNYRNLSVATLKAKAQKGDLQAQNELGIRYCYGYRGVTKNMTKAEYWIKKAADNGSGEACANMGRRIYTPYDDKGIYYLREGASLNDGESYYGLFLRYKYGDLADQNEGLAREMLLKSANLGFCQGCDILSSAYRWGDYGFPKDKSQGIFWAKRACNSYYALFLKGEPAGKVWKQLQEQLKELGCDYDPALHVDEYDAWLEDKSTLIDSQTVSHQKSQRSSANSTISSLPPTIYHYTKSGKGQSQNTGQWTDAMAPEECEVEFFDGYITVNGGIHQFVKDSGSWKVYGGQSMGFGGNNTTFYYYADANKNMKQVCELSSQYGFDTFVYPMSMNGDPTPQNNSSATSYNNTTSGSSNSNSPRTQISSKFKCAYCNGTGRIEKNDNAPASFGTDRPRQRCNECGKWYDPNVVTHYHQQCRHCGGTGYAK